MSDASQFGQAIETEVAEPINTGDSLESEWDALGGDDAPEPVEVAEEGEESEGISDEIEAASADDSGEESTESSEEDAVEAQSSESEDQSGEEESGEEDQGGEALSLADMPDDTKILAKVDGELQEITLKEFKNGISGEKAIQQRFTEYDKREKQFQAEMQQVNEYVNDLGKTMREAGVMEGVAKIGELVGIPPHQLRQALLNEITPEIYRMEGLSEVEREAEYAKSEAEYLKQKNESDAQKYQAEQAQRELQQSIETAREAHNINDNEWNEAFEYLDANLPKDQDLTVEMVSEYVQFNRATNRADTLLNEFADGSYVENEQVRAALEDVLYESPELSNEDYLELLAETYEGATKDLAEKKVEAKVQKKEAKKKQKPQQPQSEFKSITDFDGNEVLDWDDLL